MHPFWKILLLLIVALLVPLVSFLLVGAPVQRAIEEWVASKPSRPAAATLVIGLLTLDVFLPVPSSAISTLGGGTLGTTWGTVASWTGMTLGATLAFVLARRWGTPIAQRFASAKDLEQMRVVSERYGPFALVITRALPLLAEATVLMLGAQRMSWRTFLPPMLLSNLGIALALSAFGQLAERYELLPAALAISLALPFLLATIARTLLRP